jgi:hypothetical protein
MWLWRRGLKVPPDNEPFGGKRMILNGKVLPKVREPGKGVRHLFRVLYASLREGEVRIQLEAVVKIAIGLFFGDFCV